MTLQPRPDLLAATTEAQLQTQVQDLLDLTGWHWWHAPDNRPVTPRSGRRYVQAVKPGWPDLVATRGPVLLALELKTQTGRVTPEQAAWLLRLQATGAQVAVIRPFDVQWFASVLQRSHRYEPRVRILPVFETRLVPEP